MEAKLIKTVDGYELFTQGFLKGSTNHGLIDSLNIEEGSIRYKLSLKNCQAIERGYDLDELAEKRFGKSLHHAGNRCSFREGFQKALQILGDKKFSEGDLRRAYSRGKDLTSEDRFKFAEWEIFTKLVDSLQQTEWEVEIIEFEDDGTYSADGVLFKIDVDGRLILKRK